MRMREFSVALQCYANIDENMYAVHLTEFDITIFKFNRGVGN